MFHGDVSPRVGVTSPTFSTSSGQGDSRGDVSPRPLFEETREISLIQLIRISTMDLVFCLTDLIHWGFLDAFYLQI
jgi:hypothetical protein